MGAGLKGFPETIAIVLGKFFGKGSGFYGLREDDVILLKRCVVNLPTELQYDEDGSDQPRRESNRIKLKFTEAGPASSAYQQCVMFGVGNGGTSWTSMDDGLRDAIASGLIQGCARPTLNFNDENNFSSWSVAGATPIYYTFRNLWNAPANAQGNFLLQKNGNYLKALQAGGVVIAGKKHTLLVPVGIDVRNDSQKISEVVTLSVV